MVTLKPTNKEVKFWHFEVWKFGDDDKVVRMYVCWRTGRTEGFEGEGTREGSRRLNPKDQKRTKEEAK
jgi:hypothetical protein